jgi:hypothetical protein
MTFGGDFLYEDALANFKNLDKLIKYVNAEVHIYNLFHFLKINHILLININLASKW